MREHLVQNPVLANESVCLSLKNGRSINPSARSFPVASLNIPSFIS
jgi:hypothetical protein